MHKYRKKKQSMPSFLVEKKIDNTGSPKWPMYIQYIKPESNS